MGELAPRRGYADPPSGDLDTRIAEASQRLERVVERYNATREDLSATRARVRALTARVEPIDGQLAEARQRISQLASSAYKSSPVSAANLMLGADSARVMLDRLVLLDRLTRDTEAGVARLRTLSARLDEQRKALAASTARHLAQRRQLATIRARILGELAALEAMRDRADARRTGYGHRSARPALPPPTSAARARTSDRARSAIGFALAQVGKGYVFGAAGPRTYDCSGLTMAAWRRAGVYLPHNAARQWWSVPRVPRDRARPGDLVFYYGDIHHVGIYLGGGRVVHAPGWGQPVRVERVDHAPVVGYGRPG
jgi:cell wall-associated NlpC family hydrolase